MGSNRGWGTTVQEKFRTIIQTYYKGSMGIILEYGCSDEKFIEWITHFDVLNIKKVTKMKKSLGDYCKVISDFYFQQMKNS